MLGRLNRAYGTNALYVHLQRDPEAAAQSYAKRAERGIIFAYRTEILMRAPRLSKEVEMIEFSRDYVETVTENIINFLSDKPHQMSFCMENAAVDFPVFWDRTGAQGDFAAALLEWSVRHNASP